jgi:hypothetical protein
LHADSVVAGALCGEDTVISDACRKAEPGTFDAYLCDDRKLEKVQDGAVEIAMKALWKIVELTFGVRVTK